MPKSVRTNVKKMKPLYAAQPWQCRHHKDHSEILAYVEASSAWETIARVEPTAGASAEAVTMFIAQAVNAGRNRERALRDAMAALELCLEEDDLTFSSEQAAERSVISIRKLVAD